MSETPLLKLKGRDEKKKYREMFLYSDRIQTVDGTFGNKGGETLRYSQVANVDIESGWFFSTLRIESAGGKDMFLMDVPKGEAEEARRIIREQGSAPADAVSSAQTSPPDTPELLRMLAALRNAGVLTEREFSAKRDELIKRL